MRNLFKNVMAWALCAALVLVGGEYHAHAQSSGGYPSNPTFNNARVNSIVVPIASGASPAIWVQNGGIICVSLGASCGSSSVSIGTSSISIGGLAASTHEFGTFALTYVSGCTSGTPAASGSWRLSGGIAVMNITTAAATCAVTGSTGIVFSGLPAAITPATIHYVWSSVINNAANALGGVEFTNTGTVVFTPGGTYSGTANGPQLASLSYSVD